MWYSSFLCEFQNFSVELANPKSAQQSDQWKQRNQKYQLGLGLGLGEEGSALQKKKMELLLKNDFQPESRKQVSTKMTHYICNNALKRPVRDSNAITRIQTACALFTILIDVDNGYENAAAVLLAGIKIFPVDGEYGNVVSINEGERAKRASFVTQECEATNPLLLGDTLGAEIITNSQILESNEVYLRGAKFRLEAAKIVRIAGEYWKEGLLLSLAEKRSEIGWDLEGLDVEEGAGDEEKGEIVLQYDTVAVAIEELGVANAHSLKHCIGGKELQEEHLKGIENGPMFRFVMDRMLELMIGRPHLSKGAIAKLLMEEFECFT